MTLISTGRRGVDEIRRNVHDYAMTVMVHGVIYPAMREDMRLLTKHTMANLVLTCC